ncbi:MAG: hemolysin III family protein [Opitutaceae bacterium]|jgi:hemolysin III|nr:hemolysin III family protein [Opitutaceae bacterium]
MSRETHYTKGEEIAHSVTHGVGAALAGAGLWVLCVSAGGGDVLRVVSAAIYGATLLTLYLSSTLYHALTAPRWKAFFHVMDHAAIFLLIAGTYTPVLLVGVRGGGHPGWAWSLFGGEWGLAAAGVAFKVFFTGRFKVASTLVYVGMGWVVVVAAKPMLVSLTAGALWWLLAGGLAYTLGTVFYLMKGVRYHHAVWHLFVLAGSVCHFAAVTWHLLPGR